MNTFGLDWLDIFLSTAVLSVVPGLTAGFGGHLAAEAVDDELRKHKWRAVFWGLFALSVLLTFYQQIRLALSDSDRQTAEAWQATVITKILFRPIPPPPFAYAKSKTADLALSRPRESISAPNGIAIGGGATVHSPSVTNNYGVDADPLKIKLKEVIDEITDFGEEVAKDQANHRQSTATSSAL